MQCVIFGLIVFAGLCAAAVIALLWWAFGDEDEPIGPGRVGGLVLIAFVVAGVGVQSCGPEDSGRTARIPEVHVPAAPIPPPVPLPRDETERVWTT